MSRYYISTDDELKHYGVKGMKWRHHKNKEEDDEEYRKNMTTLGKTYFTTYDAFKSASNAAKNVSNFARKENSTSSNSNTSSGNTNNKKRLHSRKRHYGYKKYLFGKNERTEPKKATVKRRTRKFLWWDTGIHVKARPKRKKLPKDPKPNLHNNYQHK